MALPQATHTGPHFVVSMLPATSLPLSHGKTTKPQHEPHFKNLLGKAQAGGQSGG